MSKATRAEPDQVSVASVSPKSDGSAKVETVLLYLSNEESSAGEEVNEDLRNGLQNVFANDSGYLMGSTSSAFEERYGKSFLKDGSWSLNCARPYKNSRDTPLPLDVSLDGHPQQSPAAAASWTADGAHEGKQSSSGSRSSSGLMTASSWIAIAAASAAAMFVVVGATVMLVRCPRHRMSVNGKRNSKDGDCSAANDAVMSTPQAISHENEHIASQNLGCRTVENSII